MSTHHSYAEECEVWLDDDPELSSALGENTSSIASIASSMMSAKSSVRCFIASAHHPFFQPLEMHQPMRQRMEANGTAEIARLSTEESRKNRNMNAAKKQTIAHIRQALSDIGLINSLRHRRSSRDLLWERV